MLDVLLLQIAAQGVCVLVVDFFSRKARCIRRWAEIEEVHMWRRFARMVEPEARLIRVPRRFVGTVRVDAQPLKRLSDVERSIWLADA